MPQWAGSLEERAAWRMSDVGGVSNGAACFCGWGRAGGGAAAGPRTRVGAGLCDLSEEGGESAQYLAFPGARFEAFWHWKVTRVLGFVAAKGARASKVRRICALRLTHPQSFRPGVGDPGRKGAGATCTGRSWFGRPPAMSATMALDWWRFSLLFAPAAARVSWALIPPLLDT